MHPLGFPLPLLSSEMQHLQDLVAEATSHSFSACPLFEELCATIEDAEQCVSTAAKLVNKHRLRWRGGWGGGWRGGGGLGQKAHSQPLCCTCV